MNKGVLSAASAMQTSQQWLDVIANNLANASTVGFKRDGLALAEGFEGIVRGEGGAGEPVGTLGRKAVVALGYSDTSQGALVPTGNPLDVALTAPSTYFAVEVAGGAAYTRNGSFRIGADGGLTDQSGRAVLDEGNAPIRLGKGPVEIGAEGTIVQAGVPVAKLGVFQGDLRKVGGNLYVGTGTPIEARLQPGHLESSNVNAIEEMVAMIRLNRVFEMAQKAIQSQDESSQRLIQSAQDR